MKFIPSISILILATYLSGLHYDYESIKIKIITIIASNSLFFVGFIMLDRALPNKYHIQTLKWLIIVMVSIVLIILGSLYFIYDPEFVRLGILIFDTVLFLFVANYSLYLQYKRTRSANQSVK
jgi:hypothetical protein